VGLLDASALALLLGSFCVTKRWWSDANGTSKALRCQRITAPSEHPIYFHSHATRFTLSMDLCLALSRSTVRSSSGQVHHSSEQPT